MARKVWFGIGIVLLLAGAVGVICGIFGFASSGETTGFGIVGDRLGHALIENLLVIGGILFIAGAVVLFLSKRWRN